MSGINVVATFQPSKLSSRVQISYTVLFFILFFSLLSNAQDRLQGFQQRGELSNELIERNPNEFVGANTNIQLQTQNNFTNNTPNIQNNAFNRQNINTQVKPTIRYRLTIGFAHTDFSKFFISCIDKNVFIAYNVTSENEKVEIKRYITMLYGKRNPQIIWK